VTLPTLEEGLPDIRRSPSDAGTVELVVRRPAVDEREVLEHAQLDPQEGLIGDSWRARASGSSKHAANPDLQVTLMNARVAQLVAQARERWPLAGDQLYVDFDLSVENLPPGTRLNVGTATIEVTAEPHRGCGKFSRRFGVDAMKFVNSPAGRELNLRGVNARVVSAGTVRPGDAIRRAAA
jgi:MOSC domain-containing protein YiiM